MTVSSPLAKAVHITHEAVTAYAFPFKVFKERELAVCLVDASFRVIPLVPGVDYTVGGLGQDQGGSIALTAAGREAVGTGLSLVLLRRMDFTQETDYRLHDVFPAESHERALDILTMLCQELREQVGRAMIAPPNADEAVQYADFVNLRAAAEAARDAVLDEAGRAGSEADRAEAAADNAANEVRSELADLVSAAWAAAGQAKAAKTQARYWSTLARKWAAQAEDLPVQGGLFFQGMVLSFSGTFGGLNNRHPINPKTEQPDEGWALCDGQNGTPDLRGAFIMGAGGQYEEGDTGGSADFSLALSGLAVGATTLTTAQIPSHTHTAAVPAPSDRGSGGSAATPSQSVTGATGGGGSHTHTLSGTLTSTATNANLPPYYALAFIMKL